MQNDLFEKAFKFSPLGMALVSPDGAWLKVNNALINLLGYNETEFLSLDFIQMTHPDDLDEDFTLMEELVAGKIESYQIEKRYFHKNTSIVYALLSVSLIRNSDGGPRLFISQIQDVTELKKTQHNLQSNAKMMALGEMAAGIAHEINNPLTIINLNAKALEQLVSEPEIDLEMVSTFAHKIGDTTKRISSIVSSLRKFSNSNGSISSFENCSMDSIMQDALGLCMQKFKIKGVTLKASIPKNIFLDCHPVDVCQVLINLMNNSFYAVKDQPIKEISVAAVEENGMVILSVMDTGPGIPQEIRPKLLTPFFTTKPIGAGSGLGLSVSKSIVQVHNGDLYLDESSSATNFVVKLPVTQTQSYSKSRSEASRTASSIFPI